MINKIRIFAAGTALVTALAVGGVPALAATGQDTAIAISAVEPNIDYAIEGISQPWGLASAPDGSMVIVGSESNQISKWQNGKLTAITSQTTAGYLDGATSSSSFDHPTYSIVNSKGAIYVSDTDNHVIRKIVNDKVYTAAGNGKEGHKDGQFGDGQFGDVQFNAPTGLAVDGDDNIYVADSLNNVIRKITPDGVTSTFAGVVSEAGGYKDGSAAEAIFNEPMGLVFDEKGGLYVADSGNHLIRYIHNGKVTTVAGKATAVDTLTGYMAGGYTNGLSSTARFNRPRGLAYADGVLLIADSLNNRIRALQANGKVITIAGNSAPGNKLGVPAEAQFNQPSSLLFTAGKLYISDTLNNSVKVLDIIPKSLQPVVTKEDLIVGTELLPASKDTQVWLDGKLLKFSAAQKPYQSGDKTYLPVRELFQAWGADVKWNTAAREVHVAKGDWKLVLKANAKRTVVLEKGTVYVDVSYLEDAASFVIAHDEEYNAVIIYSGS
ncbi:WD40 repeat protein [Paenibacillus castaneae]|uniref:NHL domain-containing protein n=1 Tax=Paenibacillus castaneae TaxID=474957 RepID=UPI00141BE90B|nr:stalk domain-containing protein [Paenibacillus castaneae]NIK78233.1 WD40 repeat protein [Paenibacillus castaneae]